MISKIDINLHWWMSIDKFSIILLLYKIKILHFIRIKLNIIFIKLTIFSVFVRICYAIDLCNFIFVRIYSYEIYW
jgi:hypothetical protein